MNDSYLHILLSIRAKQLNDKGYTGIKPRDLETVFKTYIWKNIPDERVHVYVNSIMQTSDDTIIKWLAVDSKIQSSKRELSDYIDELRLGK